MHRHPLHIIALFLVGLLSLLNPPLCQADGGYIPARSFDKLPTLPRQRALIAFDGTTQTLVVESTMQAETGDRFAWILPLPAAPTSIKQVDPGLLNTLEFCCGPEIQNATHAPIGWLIFLLLITCLVTTMIATRSPATRRQCLNLLILFFLFAFLSIIAVPNFLRPTSNPRSAVTILNYERVGNYQVAVLDARSAHDIDGWLKNHQFANLPRDSSGIVDDYLTKGWVILAAQLQRSGTGLLSPHPLHITFPATQPIYPMRLTAMGNSTVDLTLFVMAPERYSHTNFHTIYADHYTSRSLEYSFPRSPLLNHKELLPLIANHGWLTRLHSKMKPRQMGQDLLFEPDRIQSEHRDEIFTPWGAIWQSLLWVSLLLAAALPTSAVISRGRQGFMIKAAPVIFLVAAVMALCIYAGKSVTYTAKTIGNYRSAKYHYYSDIRSDLEDIKNMHLASPEKVKDAVRQRVIAKRRNLYTDAPLAEEQSPGNYQFRESPSGELFLEFYDEVCGEHGWSIIDPVQEKKR